MSDDGRLETVARWGLRCEPGTALPDQPLDDAGFNALLNAARRERVQALLAWQVADGTFPATQHQHARALEAHRRSMATCVTLERRLVALDDLLTAAGIEYRILKGPAVAHLDELDPAFRTFGDLDLFVPAHSLGPACALLLGEGGRRRYPEPRPGFDRRFSKGMCVTLPDGTEVDLHRTLALGPFGLTLGLDDLFAHVTPFEVGGRSFAALDRPGRFVHACFHAVLGSDRPMLSQLRDVVLTCPESDDELHRAFDLVHTADAAIVVADAVVRAEQRLGWQTPDPIADWRASLTPSATARRRLDAYQKHRSSAALALASLGALPTWSERAAFGYAVVLPRRRAGRGRRERLRKGVSALTTNARKRLVR